MDFNKKLKVLNPEVRKNLSKLIQELKNSIDYLYEIATIDEKTGVYNNKFFKTISEMEFAKAKRGLEPISLLIVDIDNFKKLNDTYGHLVGDAVLKRIGTVLKESLRKYDVVARFGGEEFIILFPETNLQRARKVSERLRRKVAEDKEMGKYSVTFSGGLAAYHKNDSLTRIKVRADKALYKAKKNGKNKIETE